MKEIKRILIIEDDGTLLFHQEMHVQGSDDIDPVFFSNLIKVIQAFILELGETKIDNIEFQDSRIFLVKIKSSSLGFKSPEG